MPASPQAPSRQGNSCALAFVRGNRICYERRDRHRSRNAADRPGPQRWPQFRPNSIARQIVAGRAQGARPATTSASSRCVSCTVSRASASLISPSPPRISPRTIHLYPEQKARLRAVADSHLDRRCSSSPSVAASRCSTCASSLMIEGRGIYAAVHALAARSLALRAWESLLALGQGTFVLARSPPPRSCTS